MPFSDYLRVLGRRKLLLVVGLILGLALGALYAKTQTKSFQSTAQVQVGSLPTNLSTPNNISQAPPNMNTETTTATSQAVADKALSGITSAHKKLTTKMLLNDVSVSFPAKSTILTYQCTASNPHDAQVICQAMTDAYLSVRQSTAQGQIASQIKAFQGQQAAAVKDLATAEAALGTAPKGTTAADAAQNAVNAAQARNTAADQRDQPAHQCCSPTRATSPSRPRWARSPASATRSSWPPVASSASCCSSPSPSWSTRPTTGSAPRTTSSGWACRSSPTCPGRPSADQKALNDPASWPSAKRRAYGKLAARVLVASRRRELSVITLMGVGDEPTDRLVAANFAVALAQAGRRVNLVLTGAGGGSATGNTAPASAAPGTPGLPATQNTSPELLPSPVAGLHFTELTAVNGSVNMDAADFLSGDLRRGADFVIVAAPPMTTAADSLVLASVSDATILVANEKTSRRGELGEAADSLVQIGAPLFGVVLTRKGGRKSRRHRAADRRAGNSLSMSDVPGHRDDPPALTGGSPTFRIRVTTGPGRPFFRLTQVST